MTPEEIAAGLKAVEDELSTHLTAQETEIKTLGETQKETADEISKLTQDYVGLQASMKEANEARDAEHKELQEDLQKRIDDLEAEAKRGFLSSGDFDELKSPGEAFVESEEYKQLIEAGEYKSRPVNLKTFFPEVQRWASKTARLSTPPDRLVVPMRADAVTPQLRILRMRDLVPVRPTGSNAIEFVREVGFNAGVPISVTTAAVASGVATITTASPHGLVAGARATIAGVTDETDLNGTQWVTGVTSATVYTFNTTAGDTVGATGTITSLTEQTHGAAAETAEGADKPEAQLDLELITQPVQTIAHFIPASRQILADSAMMEAYINDRLRYGVLYREDSQILYGSGSSPQIQGIMTADGVQVLVWSTLPSGTTKIDALRKAMTQSQKLEHVASGVVLAPQDWEDIQLLKGTDEHYIWLSVSTGTGQQFFLLPVVVTNAINEGESLVGAFQTGTTLWDREQVSVRVSDSHEDYFKKNLVAILGEERVCQTINRPDAFVRVNFDSAP